MAEVRVVTVDIGGQQYPIRSALDPTYVAELAAYVDQKMRAASDAAPASDGLGVAILVALNIADELFRAVARQSSADGVLNKRALALEQLLDDVLSQADAPGIGNGRLGLSNP
jgi:cell division protein ZapA (FtsZ GTPase activity inhibitor)